MEFYFAGNFSNRTKGLFYIRLIQCFQYVAKIVCPSLLFKSEAIVHPDEVVKYIGQNECRLSYNPLQMALFWSTLASRDTRLLTESLKKRWSIPNDCAWVNYISLS